MKKILVVIGCGKKNGNTEQLADSFIKGATEAGHQVKKAFLGDKTIKFCMGCNACVSKGRCIHKDDMNELYDDYNDCDMIVLASPLYYWTLTGMLKTFLDRLFGSGADDKKEKESVLLITARLEAPETFEQVISYYQFHCIKYMGWKNKGMVLAGGCGGVYEDRLIAQTKYLEEGYNLGKSV